MGDKAALAQSETTAPKITKIIQSAPQQFFTNYRDFTVRAPYLYYIGSKSHAYPTEAEPYYLFIHALEQEQTIADIELPRTYSLYHFGDTIYAATLASEHCHKAIYLIDVAVPTKPHIRQHYCWPNIVTDLFVDGNLLYIADQYDTSARSQSGLSVIDFTIPHAPQLAGYVRTRAVSPQIAKMNDTIYLLDESLSAFRYTPPQATVRLDDAGGTLDAAFDHVAYHFADDTFTITVTVTHTTRFVDPLRAFRSPQLGVGDAFALTATATNSGAVLQPNRPFSITLTYADEAVQLVDETTLALYRWAGDKWVKEEGSQVNPETNTVAVSPETTGIWMLSGISPRCPPISSLITFSWRQPANDIR